MSNDFSRLTAAQTLNASSAVTTIVSGTPNGYGFTAAQLEALTDGSVLLKSAVENQHNAEQAAKTATKDKNDKKADLAAGLSALLKTAVANPNVTDAMLLAIGFSPRKVKLRAMALVAPTGLTAEAFVDGTVKLKWDRNGNVSNTIFVIETSADGANWTMLKAVQRVSLLVDGYAPGVAAWFRVTATRSNLTSPASAPASVYAPVVPIPVQLRVA